MRRIIRRPSHGTVVAYLALFVALATGTAWAAATIGSKDIKRHAIHSRHIKKKAVKTSKLAPDAVKGGKVDESTLGQVPDADRIDGLDASAFLRSTIYRNESAVGPGTPVGGGTFYIDESCDAGDQLLSGGPVHLSGGTDTVESSPTPGSTNSWRARIRPRTLEADNFSVVVLCANQG